MHIRMEYPHEDVDTIRREVELDEAFNYEGDLTVVGYDDETGAPVGLIGARRSEHEAVAVIECMIMRPAFEYQSYGLELALEWVKHMVERGFTQAVAGIPKDKDLEEMLRLVERFGFVPYHEDDERVWHVKDLLAEARQARQEAAAPTDEASPREVPAGETETAPASTGATG